NGSRPYEADPGREGLTWRATTAKARREDILRRNRRSDYPGMRIFPGRQSSGHFFVTAAHELHSSDGLLLRPVEQRRLIGLRRALHRPPDLLERARHRQPAAR